jgi:transcriptional/translational regulatory protein YebC/TACO1
MPNISGVIHIMSNENEALAICSEFAEEYGVDIEDGESIVVYMKSEYINELKNMLERKEYKLKSFKVYGDEALVNFIPKK